METVVEKAWSKSKLLIKASIIGGIVLLLQIPAFYVKELVSEREIRQQEAMSEVSSKWAGRQTVSGPVLVLPYWEYSSDTSARRNGIKNNLYLMPDILNINAEITPQERHRGIYKVMLYKSHLKLSGKFSTISLEKVVVPRENIIWNEALVRLDISDLKGISDEISLKSNGKQLNVLDQPAVGHEQNGVYASLEITTEDEIINRTIEMAFDLNGSGQLLFNPVGKHTTVEMRSKWPHPSFVGDLLPQSTQVRDSGFMAVWKSRSHKRIFPVESANQVSQPGYTAATPAATRMPQGVFGADIFIPVNSYQKTMRSVKYAALCILLTFAGFFLIETNNRKSVHPFQYGLIGAALILFYTLLLSFSEYIGFNPAYAVASVFTIGLIGWFVRGLLSSSKLSMVLSIILVLIYTYVFTILQLQDYALLLGSIGLFVTLAIIMYFSRKFQW